MEKKENRSRAHCLVLPYPRHGHINPMLQFSKRLVHNGAKVTLALTRFISKSLLGDLSGHGLDIEAISDGYDEGGVDQSESKGAYLERFRAVGSETLGSLIEKLKNSDRPVDCVVYDSFLPWALDVAKKFGVLGAPFFTQSATVNNIYFHVHGGTLKPPLACDDDDDYDVGGLMLPLASSDLPSFVRLHGSYPALLEMFVDQFSNIHEVDWIFCNTFHKLEDKAVDWMGKLGPVVTIGPTVPSAYLDNRLEDDRDYGLHTLDPLAAACIGWLYAKPDGSVVYASFGSFAELQPRQMEEIAWGLRRSDADFLMVVRESERPKLPPDFEAETAEKGLVVPWCPQLQVLAHRAVGCFLSHGGWNSVLEAISLGVPMVVAPLWTDQPTNAKLVEDVWGIGVRAPADETGVVGREAVERCVREVMGSEEIRRNVLKWKGLAREAVDEGGSSDRCIREFVAKLSLS